MIQGKKILALVPARSGSKGLPSKNIIDFLGKPLISWSIDAATNCEYIDKTVVSTDSESIASIGRIFGAQVPFIRPDAIAGDLASTMEVVEHAIRFMRDDLSEEYDILVLLEPTSPLRSSRDICQALENLLANSEAKSLVSVGRVETQFPNFQFKIAEDGFLTSISEGFDFKAVRRQEIDNHFFLDGSIYISFVDRLMERGSFIGSDTLALVLPKWKNVEIDDEYDYEMALALARRYL